MLPYLAPPAAETVDSYSFEPKLPAGVEFNGIDSELRTRANAFDDDIDSDRQFTMSLWFRANSLHKGTLFQVASSPTSRSQSYYLEVVDTGNVRFLAYTTSGQTQTTTDLYNIGMWHQVVVTSDGSANRKLYLDGVWQSTSSSSKSVTTTFDNAIIAARIDSLNYFDGAIAHVTLWGDDVLDLHEIEALGKGVSPLDIRPQAITAYWPLNTPDGRCVTDKVVASSNPQINNQMLFTNPPAGMTAGPDIPAARHHRINPQLPIPITTPKPTALTYEYTIPDPRWEAPAIMVPGVKPTGPVEIDWDHPGTSGLLWSQVHPWQELVHGYVADDQEGPPIQDLMQGAIFNLTEDTLGGDGRNFRCLMEVDVQTSYAGNDFFFIYGGPSPAHGFYVGLDATNKFIARNRNSSTFAGAVSTITAVVGETYIVDTTSTVGGVYLSIFDTLGNLLEAVSSLGTTRDTDSSNTVYVGRSSANRENGIRWVHVYDHDVMKTGADRDRILPLNDPYLFLIPA